MSDVLTKSPEEYKESEKDDEKVDLLSASATTSEEASNLHQYVWILKGSLAKS